MTARVRKRVLAGSRRTWADSRFIVPADGTSAATVGNGDFGTSPFFGSSRASRGLPVSRHLGCRDVKDNGGWEIKRRAP
jgi:hypothetical protein